MTYPTRDAIKRLNRALHLPTTGREQDWDIELADPHRTSEFIAYLETNVLGTDEKCALMALILASLEDLANSEEIPAKLADRVKRALKADATLYVDLIKRWGPSECGQDDFAISAMVGSL